MGLSIVSAISHDSHTIDFGRRISVDVAVRLHLAEIPLKVEADVSAEILTIGEARVVVGDGPFATTVVVEQVVGSHTELDAMAEVDASIEVEQIVGIASATSLVVVYVVDVLRLKETVLEDFVYITFKLDGVGQDLIGVRTLLVLRLVIVEHPCKLEMGVLDLVGVDV